MAMRAGAYIVPTMQITQEDLGELRAGTLPCHVVWNVQGACAEPSAMPGNATEDFAATADADFVMRAGVVHRRPGADGGGG